MLLQEYEIKYNVRPVSELENYCRLERLDPINKHSISKNENAGINRRMFIYLNSILMTIFGTWNL